MPSDVPFCDVRPVFCTAAQYNKGCRGEECTEAHAARIAHYREHGTSSPRVLREVDIFGIRYPGEKDIAWREKAACRGVPHHVFFPEIGERYDVARTYCEKCPVKARCLEFARATDGTWPEGMYGGLSPRERKRLRRSA